MTNKLENLQERNLETHKKFEAFAHVSPPKKDLFSLTKTSTKNQVLDLQIQFIEKTKGYAHQILTETK